MGDMRLIVAGAAGRMGHAVISLIAATKGVTLVGALERPQSDAVGQDAGILPRCGDLGVTITSDALAAVVAADGIIDFTTPGTSVELAALAAQARIVHVIGTTGFSAADEDRIEAASHHAVIVKSGNMSLGVNLLTALVEQVAQALGPDYDIEIVETHHRMKVDAPSGTAWLLGDAAARGRGVALAEKSVRSRDGHTGARESGAIGFASLRGGTVVGEHVVIFAGPGERLELAHRAEDRGIFARGALHAALWGRGKKPGLYTMADVLGLAAPGWGDAHVEG
jgi:4-hydroxy-tetrahydrodipicolinate reductase